MSEFHDNTNYLKIDFSQIVVPEEQLKGIAIAPANIESTNITGTETIKQPTFEAGATSQNIKGSGNVFAGVTNEKPSMAELQRVVQKLEKLEKMINPNSKKSLILWEEDNSFKNLIKSIVTYSNECDTNDEFPIELYDRLKALKEDVEKQQVEGKAKIEELTKQSKINAELGTVLSEAYISATAGIPIEQIETTLTAPEISEYKAQIETIISSSPDSEEYAKAEKDIKTKINNLENSVHIAIDLERTTSKGGALDYINAEITPALARLTSEYEKQYAASVATEIDGEEAITALAVKKTFAERVYDTFVRPFANLFRRKNKSKS